MNTTTEALLTKLRALTEPSPAQVFDEGTLKLLGEVINELELLRATQCPNVKRSPEGILFCDAINDHLQKFGAVLAEGESTVMLDGAKLERTLALFAFGVGAIMLVQLFENTILHNWILAAFNLPLFALNMAIGVRSLKRARAMFRKYKPKANRPN